MKIRVWIAITDGGDGEHHASIYPSKEKLIEEEGIDSDGFDEFGYLVEISYQDIHTDNYEIVP